MATQPAITAPAGVWTSVATGPGAFEIEGDDAHFIAYATGTPAAGVRGHYRAAYQSLEVVLPTGESAWVRPTVDAMTVTVTEGE